MYTPSSSFVGYVAPDPAWQGVLDAHAAVGGSKAILASYARWGNQYNLNTNLAIAQACLECTYFTSERWVKQWNPCGLGVTSSSVPGPSWGSLDDGIRAHLEHICCYVYTLAQCPVDHAHTVDPRHGFHDGVPQFQTLERPPTRQWAVPGTTYVQDILAIVNGVVSGPPPPPPPATEPQPWDRIHTAADIGPTRAIGDVQWFVVHDTEGHFAGDEAVLTDAAPPVESVHFLVGRVPGQCVYMVDIGSTAWTAGNDQLSEAAVQVELSKAPDESGYTDYQYRTLAAIYRWCVQQGMTGVPPVYIGPHPPDSDNGPLPDVPGIIGHEGVPDGVGGWGGTSHHTDPGPDFDWPRFIGLIGQPAPPDPYLHLNGHLIGGGFKDFYLAIPEAIRLQDIGLPTSDEQTEQVTDPAADGVDAHGVTRDRTVQHFERGILIYQPEQPPAWQVVRAMETQIISRTTVTASLAAGQSSAAPSAPGTRPTPDTGTRNRINMKGQHGV